MAQKVSVTLVDDLDGGQADETVTFGIDGKHYEIDVSSANAKKLRGVLADFVTAARRPSDRRRSSNPAKSATPTPAVDREQNQAIRDWARQNGMAISARGRIPQEAVAAFHAQH